MSYNLMFAGHKDFETEAEAVAFEERVAEHARGIAATLDGLTSASGSFEHLGPMQLKPQATDEPVNSTASNASETTIETTAPEGATASPATPKPRRSRSKAAKS